MITGYIHLVWYLRYFRFAKMIHVCRLKCLSVIFMKYTYLCFISSARSSSSHTDLLLIPPPTPPPHFFRSHQSSTPDFHFLSNYSYIKAIILYKGNHWTRCAGFMDASWVRLGTTNDDLGTSWALPGDNLGMTWG